MGTCSNITMNEMSGRDMGAEDPIVNGAGENLVGKAQENVSDDDSETEILNISSKTKLKGKMTRLIDSDSSSDEIEGLQTLHDNSKDSVITMNTNMECEFSGIEPKDPLGHIVKNKSFKSRVMDRDSSDDETMEVSKDVNKTLVDSTLDELNETKEKHVSNEPVKKSLQDIIRDIVDSESSDDENNESVAEDQNDKDSPQSTSDNENESEVLPRDRSSKVQRKSAKQAQENMQLIQSESQRMSREAEISVPYHRPRQCTLKEFLGRRNIRRPIVNDGSKKQKSNIHMRGEELLKYAKHLEARAKEAELFFKTNPENEETEIGVDKPVHEKSSEKFLSENENSNETESNTRQADSVIDITKTIQTESDKIIEENDLENTENTDFTKIIESLSKDDSFEEEISELNIEIVAEKPKSVEIEEPVASTSKQADELLAEYENAMKNNEIDGLENTKKKLSENAFCALSDSDDDLEIMVSKFPNLDKAPRLSEGVPRLSGGPGMVIDLEEDRVMSQGVGQLMQRFVKHAKVKPPTEKASISVEAASKTTEGLIVNLDECESNKKNPIPGLALQKLRNELQARMAQRRSEEFSKKLKKQEEEKALDDETDILDDEFDENDDLELQLSSSDDEIDDLKKSAKKKDNFLDVEADDEDSENPDDENMNEENSDNEKQEESDDGKSDVEEEVPESGNTQQIKKTLRRIQTMESSDSEEEINVDKNDLKTLKRNSTELFQSQYDDNDVIPLHQTKFIEPQTTPQFKNTICSELSLLSPVLFPAGTPDTPLSFKSLDKSQTPEQSSTFHKRLFSESSDTSPQKNTLNKLFEQTQEGATQAKCTQDELLDLCSGKFPTQQDVSNNPISLDEFEIPNNSDRLYLSDDEARDVLRVADNNSDKKEKKVKRKKNITKLQYSDDEDSGKENVYESDLEDEDVVEKVYDYDSEENEIVVNMNKEEFKKEAKKFLENEAELSESDWGSADEDEKDLDKLEYELGDEDEFDDKKVRGELERIHNRQVLDQDKREVRLLQELLLEDGENHGDATRERKFKWKNVEDVLSLDQKADKQEGEMNGSDEEDQTEWRKNRFEREKVLREKQLKLDDISATTGLLSDSLIPEPLSEKKTNLIVKNPIPETSKIVMYEKDESFLALGSLKKASYRGSFLKRDEATLSRLSALMRSNVDGQEATALASTSKGNFVFSTISPVQNKVTAEEKSKKRASTVELSNENKKVKRLKPPSSKKLLLDYLE